jgi:hypothetical protein
MTRYFVSLFVLSAPDLIKKPVDFIHVVQKNWEISANVNTTILNLL